MLFVALLNTFIMPDRPAKSGNSYLFFIFIAAIILRAAFDFFLKKYYFFYDHPAGDVEYYQTWAKEILLGNWIGGKTFYGLPLYPYFLAMVKSVSLGATAVVKAIHIILGAINCLLISLVALKVFDRKASIVAGILAVANYTLFFYDTTFMPVTLEVFFSLLIVYFFLNQQLLVNVRQWFLFGIVIGIGSLGDGKLVIATALIAAAFYFFSQSADFRRPQGLRLMMMVLGMMLVITLTGLRNKIVGGSWVWISAQSGLSFYVGNNERAGGIYEHPNFLRPDHAGQDEDQIIWAQTATGKKMSDAEVSQYWRSQGIAFIREQPLSYVRLLGKKMLHFLKDDEAAYDVDMILQRDIKTIWDINPYYLLLPWAVLGFAVSRANKKTIYMDAMIFAQLIFVLIFFMSYRHRATILPFFLMYQAVGILWVLEKLLTRRFLPAATAILFTLLFVVVIPPQPLNSAEFEFLSATKRGSVFEKRKMLSESRAQYLKALGIRPDDTNTLYNLAYTYALEGRFSEAANYYQTILAYNPTHVDALYNFAFANEELGRYDVAGQYYQKVVELQPYSLDSRYRLGMLFYKQRMCPQAIEQFAAIKSLRPEFADEVQKLIVSCP